MEQRLVRKVVVRTLERISRYCSVNSDFQVSVEMNAKLQLFYFPFIDRKDAESINESL